MLLPPSEWPLKPAHSVLLAHVDSPFMQMSHKILRRIRPNFTKFVAIVIFASTVLTQQPELRFIHPLSNEKNDI